MSDPLLTVGDLCAFIDGLDPRLPVLWMDGELGLAWPARFRNERIQTHEPGSFTVVNPNLEGGAPAVLIS